MADRPKLSLLRSDRRIIIKQVDGQFRVCVEPALDREATKTFPTYREARGHAGGLRLVNRWPIEDQAGDFGMSK